MRFINSLRQCIVLLIIAQLYIINARHTSLMKVQLFEDKISQHNDTSYVRQIMRLSKAAEMRNYMHEDADACDNFFEYTCGNWATINPAEHTKPRETNFFQLLINAYNQKLLKMLKEHRQSDDDEAEGKVKDFFESCQKTKEMSDGRYRLKLRAILAEFGPMPAMLPDGMWYGEDFNWQTTVANIQKKYGQDVIVQFMVRQDFNNKTLNKLFVGKPILKLQAKAMYREEATQWHRDQYKLDIQKNLVKYLGIDEEKAVRTAAEILNFEVELAKGLPDAKTSKPLKSLSKLRTLDELQAAYAPTIDFKYLITAIFGENFNQTVYEYYLDYQVNLAEVIKKTRKPELANYILYQLAQLFFFNVEVSDDDDREAVCLDSTKEFFAKVLDKIMFRKYNSDGTQADINVIWQKIKETFKAELESGKLDWMTLMTRKMALQKLDGMKLNINVHDKVNLSEEYAVLNITNNDFVHNSKQVLIFLTQRAIESIYEVHKPIDGSAMLSFSPAYIASENLIKIPVALLQPNFFWSDHYPHALKFGTLGYLVAHELIHGFDDLGRNFDHLGNDNLWWDEASTQAFDKRKNCFQQQYARFLYGGKYLPESELQSENIADNGAVQIAYTSYMNWLDSISAANMSISENITATEQLPNMKYTNKQLFYISFAQFWCNDVNERFKDKVALVNTHAPAMFRVIGPLSNFMEFSKAFNCAADTTMNPTKKCQIY